ncbi:MAG: hypothetical protein SFT94_00730, partial [Pseudanabaenaceae cyanobacterium bins.68]|nr:hypothetical protein [Pseudanabaenaceae cyanobacterium bins.68]
MHQTLQKIGGVTALATSLLAFSAPAQAITLNWSFVPIDGPTGANPYVVRGTIDGLQIGSNSGTGITATVTNTPTGELEGTVFNIF